MARNVNVWLTNWHWTGIEVLTPQAAVDIHIEWVDDEGQQREHTETIKFPNVLADVPVPWLKERLEDLILIGLRKKLGIDR
jgi:hypothetical protein